MTTRTEQLVSEIHQKMGSLVNDFQGVKKEVIEWRRDYREVQSAKDRLEKLQSEGLMKFTAKVDSRSFHVLCAIIACGDMAKASEVLKTPYSTIYDLKSQVGKKWGRPTS